VGIDRVSAYEHTLLEHATPWLADIAGHDEHEVGRP
jgi:hypothetical protein